MPEVHGTNAYTQSLNQNIRQNYTAMCENIDWNVGRILEKLDTLKIADRTIVLYFCDNGPHGDQTLKSFLCRKSGGCQSYGFGIGGGGIGIVGNGEMSILQCAVAH